MAAAGQTVYARGNGLQVGQRYAVYREGEPYIFTDANGKSYNAGVELLQVASGVAVQNEQDITTLELTQSYNGEVRRGIGSCQNMILCYLPCSIQQLTIR